MFSEDIEIKNLLKMGQTTHWHINAPSYNQIY